MDVDILENLNRSIMLEDAFRILREIPDLQYWSSLIFINIIGYK